MEEDPSAYMQAEGEKKKKKKKNRPALRLDEGSGLLPLALRFYPTVYLLYYYKSTNNDAAAALRSATSACVSGFTTQFTCFTSTKVQILTQKALLEREERVGGGETCSVYLLY
jgi:hypothetical protein